MTVSFQNGSFLNGSATAGSLTLSGGVTSSSLYNNEYLDKKYDYSETKESYEIAYSGRDTALDTKISKICSYLENGKEDKALSAYNELLKEMSKQTRYSQLSEDGDDTQLRAIARQLIESETGTDLEDYIIDNTDNSFERGWKINWNGDKAQEEDLLLEMCDIDNTSRLSGLAKVGGGVCRVGAGVAAGAAAGAAIGTIIPVAGTAIGAGFGAVVGGIGSVLSFLL